MQLYLKTYLPSYFHLSIRYWNIFWFVIYHPKLWANNLLSTHATFSNLITALITVARSRKPTNFHRFFSSYIRTYTYTHTYIHTYIHMHIVAYTHTRTEQRTSSIPIRLTFDLTYSLPVSPRFIDCLVPHICTVPHIFRTSRTYPRGAQYAAPVTPWCCLLQTFTRTFLVPNVPAHMDCRAVAVNAGIVMSFIAIDQSIGPGRVIVHICKNKFNYTICETDLFYWE
jgi:hypothetical protein